MLAVFGLLRCAAFLDMLKAIDCTGFPFAWLAANFENDGQIARLFEMDEKGVDKLDIVVINPIQYKFIGRQKTNAAGFLDGMQRPDPGIELLWRKFCLKVIDTPLPKIQ